MPDSKSASPSLRQCSSRANTGKMLAQLWASSGPALADGGGAGGGRVRIPSGDSPRGGFSNVLTLQEIPLGFIGESKTSTCKLPPR